MEAKKTQLKAILEDDEKLTKAATKAFKGYDKDKSGKLDQSEVYDCLKTFTDQLTLPPPSEEQVKEFIENLDRGDTDGQLDVNEFKILMKCLLTVSLELIEAGLEF
mmetsp:Transcript_36069/g.41654  ORF Transcript_36069/g.41654 Transcript_36069/m.41654 type:complete len:106 (-) Transcript_36069:10-327(-)